MLYSVLGREASLTVTVGGPPVGSRTENGDGPTADGTGTGLHAHPPRSFRVRYTFDTFVIGAGNRFDHAATLAVAETPGVVYNPLFIYGGWGSGRRTCCGPWGTT